MKTQQERKDVFDLKTAAASITRALQETVPGSVYDACARRAYEALERIANRWGLEDLAKLPPAVDVPAVPPDMKELPARDVRTMANLVAAGFPGMLTSEETFGREVQAFRVENMVTAIFDVTKDA